MKAIVCDCCGKCVLLSFETPWVEPKGFHKVYDADSREAMELCDECFEKLTKAVREAAEMED